MAIIGTTYICVCSFQIIWDCSFQIICLQIDNIMHINIPTLEYKHASELIAWVPNLRAVAHYRALSPSELGRGIGSREYVQPHSYEQWASVGKHFLLIFLLVNSS